MVQIKRLQEADAEIIALIGEIDASSSIDLDLAIAKSVGEGFKKILVDCHALEYISSAGLGVFMSYIEELREKNIYMVLFGLKEKVANTFEILGLAGLLHIRENKNDALKLAHELSV
ncbi:MAG: STAS domain-containing protein [Bacteroidetes bacterium]|nr:STAS domain-containing protein [Bacteroidota bacterium]